MKDVVQLINEAQSLIVRYWQEIKLNNETIHQERLKFFERKKDLESMQGKLVKILNNLEEEAYILEVPSKFPEAFTKTIEELKRRKAVNLATEKVCYYL